MSLKCDPLMFLYLEMLNERLFHLILRVPTVMGVLEVELSDFREVYIQRCPWRIPSRIITSLGGNLAPSAFIIKKTPWRDAWWVLLAEKLVGGEVETASTDLFWPYKALMWLTEVRVMVQLERALHGLWYAEEQTTADRLGFRICSSG